MSGVYGSVRVPGSRFIVAVFCFASLSHSFIEAVSNVFPEPAVPIIKTTYILGSLLALVRRARGVSFEVTYLF